MENLIMGYRFSPSDEEGLCFLLRFIAGKMMNDSGFITTTIDTYGNEEPWQIYSDGVPCGDDDDDDDCSQYLYFITKLKKKGESRYCRNVGNRGSWKQNFKRKPIRKNGGPVIGYKKGMSYVNKGYNGENGHWLMKEYELSKEILDQFDNDCRDYVFCAIKKRTPTKDTRKLINTVSEVCTNILEHQTPMDVESTIYDDTLQGEVMDAGEYMQSSNSVPQLECMNLEYQTSAAVESTSYYEALQGGVMDAGEYMQSNSLELQNNMHEGRSIVVEPLSAPYTFEAMSMLEFNYEYLPADFDCVQSITASLGNC